MVTFEKDDLEYTSVFVDKVKHNIPLAECILKFPEVVFNRNKKCKRYARRLVETEIGYCQTPRKAIAKIEEWAENSGVSIPHRFVTYEPADETLLTPELSRNHILARTYWDFKDVCVVDDLIKTYKSFGVMRITLTPKLRLSQGLSNSSLRVSPLQVTQLPVWIRHSVYPTDRNQKYLYFDVANAEFANLLTYVDPSFIDMYKYNDFYTLIQQQLQERLPEIDIRKQSRSLFKMFCMAMVCGGTTNAIQKILSLNYDDALRVYNTFWEMFPGVEAHLQSVWWYVQKDRKLVGESVSHIPMARFENKYYAKVYTDKDTEIYSTYVRESFSCLFATLLQQICSDNIAATHPQIRIVYTWVDSCLIPVPKGMTYKQAAQMINYNINGAHLKINYGLGPSWGQAQDDSKDRFIFTD
jgi:hypothetical protein